MYIPQYNIGLWIKGWKFGWVQVIGPSWEVVSRVHGHKQWHAQCTQITYVNKIHNCDRRPSWKCLYTMHGRHLCMMHVKDKSMCMLQESLNVHARLHEFTYASPRVRVKLSLSFTCTCIKHRGISCAQASKSTYTVHVDYTCQRTESLCMVHIGISIPCTVHGRPMCTMHVKEKPACAMH